MGKPPLLIRRLGSADAPAWAALRLDLWPGHTLEELAGEIVDPDEAALVGFGAFVNGVVIGMAEASERAYGDGCETAPVGWLEGIYIVPAHRRGGVGRLLVAAVEDWARARGLRELGSDAELDNLVSRLGHFRWGFEETGRAVLFRKAL